jgi:ferritin-like metal-binding protein YciE
MAIASYQLLDRIATRVGDETAEIALNRAEEEAMAPKLEEHWRAFARVVPRGGRRRLR